MRLTIYNSDRATTRLRIAKCFTGRECTETRTEALPWWHSGLMPLEWWVAHSPDSLQVSVQMGYTPPVVLIVSISRKRALCAKWLCGLLLWKFVSLAPRQGMSLDIPK